MKWCYIKQNVAFSIQIYWEDINHIFKNSFWGKEPVSYFTLSVFIAIEHMTDKPDFILVQYRSIKHTLPNLEATGLICYSQVTKTSKLEC